ncbi:MAG: RodZ domain-containing protein [Stellaceae bacterium]
MTAATPASSPQVAVTPGPAAAASPATSTRDAEANPAAATQTNPAPANPAPANSVPANRAPANSVPGDAAASSAVRIVVQATADSWIEVRDQNHAILFTGVLKPGERYLVPDHPGISMRTGNAGGLEMTVDGKLQPPLGPSGAIRNVALDPQTSSGATAAQ